MPVMTMGAKMVPEDDSVFDIPSVRVGSTRGRRLLRWGGLCSRTLTQPGAMAETIRTLNLVAETLFTEAFLARVLSHSVRAGHSIQTKVGAPTEVTNQESWSATEAECHRAIFCR